MGDHLVNTGLEHASAPARRDTRVPMSRPAVRGVRHLRALVALVSMLALAVAGASACQSKLETPHAADFNTFALEVADALATGDVARLIAQTSKVRFTCDEHTKISSPCAGIPAGGLTEGFDVKFKGHGDEPTFLNGEEMRALLDGLNNPDPHAPPDEFGRPDLQIYSTLYPDPTLFLASDQQQMPTRGTLAITYVGVSPGERDASVKRRLFGAVAEADSSQAWHIRLWLVGFFDPQSPQFHPGQGNAWKRWSLPTTPGG
jgi:hypothetical protein